MKGLVIRRAQAKDAGMLADLDRACFSDPWSLKSYQEELETNVYAFYLLAEVDGRPAGYAGLWCILDEGHITNVAVLPHFRGKHIASALLQELTAQTGALGLTAYTLEVRRSNHAAIRLYEQFGFRVEGVRPHYYQSDGEDALLMWKREEKEGNR